MPEAGLSFGTTTRPNVPFGTGGLKSFNLDITTRIVSDL